MFAFSRRPIFGSKNAWCHVQKFCNKCCGLRHAYYVQHQTSKGVGTQKLPDRRRWISTPSSSKAVWVGQNKVFQSATEQVEDFVIVKVDQAPLLPLLAPLHTSTSNFAIVAYLEEPSSSMYFLTETKISPAKKKRKTKIKHKKYHPVILPIWKWMKTNMKTDPFNVFLNYFHQVLFWMKKKLRISEN